MKYHTATEVGIVGVLLIIALFVGWSACQDCHARGYKAGVLYGEETCRQDIRMLKMQLDDLAMKFDEEARKNRGKN